MERTYIMIKPEGVQRNLVGKIIQRFEDKSLKLVRIESKLPSKDLVRKHYAELSSKGFFNELVDHLSSGTVICMIWEGENAVHVGRQLIGATNPLDSTPGSIRGDYAVNVGQNVVHGSDSIENAKREIDLWFE